MTESRIIRAEIGFAASTLDGIEDLRMATANRVRILVNGEEDSDGVLRGLARPADDKYVLQAQGTLDALEQLEHQAILNLQRTVRKHPVYPFIKATQGLGEKQTGRLLAAIGDPYWHDAEDRPRTVSELWSYSGYAVVGGSAPKKQKGKTVNWSPDARMRTYLIAESCVKQAKGTRYRNVYDDARDKYADAVHSAPCVRCGPSGKPAEAGSPLSLGHQHARALRAISKEILKDLWIAAKDVHAQKEEA